MLRGVQHPVSVNLGLKCERELCRGYPRLPREACNILTCFSDEHLTGQGHADFCGAFERSKHLASSLVSSKISVFVDHQSDAILLSLVSRLLKGPNLSPKYWGTPSPFIQALVGLLMSFQEAVVGEGDQALRIF